MLSRQRTQTALACFLAILLLCTGIGTGRASAHLRTPSSPTLKSGDKTELPCPLPANYKRSNFNHSTDINNIWFPLVPGTQFTLDGFVTASGESLDHQVIFTVTDLTKTIDGVRTVVVWDRDISSGELEEAELAFFAQDNDGNVWSLGEYPEEYENKKFVGAPSTWIVGQEDAKAGIAMLSEPRLGTPQYLQGWSPNIDFLDCAQVFAQHQQVSVPANDYDNVLVTDEVSPLDPASGHQRKFYAPMVGNVQITAVDDPEGETLALTSYVQLDPGALAEAHRAALKLDRRAYRVSEVYGATLPAH